MSNVERSLTALAKMLGIGVRVSRGPGGFHMQLGGTPADSREGASFGQDAVLSYSSWNGRYSATGGFALDASEVAVYLAVWSKNRSADVHHVRHLFREAMGA